jgi:hypothetical protein
MNGSGTSSVDGGLKSFYGYKETFNKDSVWVDIPRNREWFDISGISIHLLISSSDICAYH